jgi:hypothetical protein
MQLDVRGDPYRMEPSRLRISDWVDVKLLGTLNLHFVPEDAVNDDGSRVISYSWSKPIIGVRLFPYSAILQTNHGPARQSVKGPIYTADK